MKKIILLPLLLFLAVSTNAQLRTKVYVTYFGTDTISCIDENSRTFSKSISINTPSTPVINNTSNDNSIFIRAGYNLFQFSSIDNSNKKAKSIPRIEYLKYSHDNKYLLASYKYVFYKIDTATLTIVDSFIFRTPKHSYYEVDFIPLNDSIIFYNGGEKAYKYNLNTRQNIDSLNVRMAIQFQHYNGKIYYGRLDTLHILDVEQMKITDSVLAHAQLGWVPSESIEYNGKLYFHSSTLGSNREYFIEPFDPLTKKFLPPIKVEHASQVYISPEGNIWMCGYLGNKIYVYSIKEKKIIDIVSVSRMPRKIIFSKGYNHKSSIKTIKDQNSTKLYPNPATNKIILETGYNTTKSFSIINSLGKTVMSFESNGTETEVDISSLPPGVYFVIQDGDKTGAMKFVKQ